MIVIQLLGKISNDLNLIADKQNLIIYCISAYIITINMNHKKWGGCGGTELETEGGGSLNLNVSLSYILPPCLKSKRTKTHKKENKKFYGKWHNQSIVWH